MKIRRFQKLACNLYEKYKYFEPIKNVPANICWSWSCLQHVFSVTILCLQRRLEDIFKISWGHLARRLEDVLKMSLRLLGKQKIVTLKTSWGRLEDMSWRHREDMSWRCLEDMPWRRLEDFMEPKNILTGDTCILIWG